MNKQRKSGFTLIEILGVFAILGTIFSVILSGVQKSKERKADLSVKSQLAEIQLDVSEYDIAPGVTDFTAAFTAKDVSDKLNNIASELGVVAGEYEYVATPDEYVVVFPLNKVDTFYCIDSTGASSEVSGLLNITGPRSCSNATRYVAVSVWEDDSGDTGRGGGGGGGGSACIPTQATSSSILATLPFVPGAIAVDSSGNVYTTLGNDNKVSKTTPGGVTTTFNVGTAPIGIFIDPSDNVYVSNGVTNNVSKITPGGVVTTFGSTGSMPNAIVVDSSGNIYTANRNNNNITKITPAGVSSTFALTGDTPLNMTIDTLGNLYTANNASKNVSKITPLGVSTILGTTSNDYPRDIVVDSSGNVYTNNYYNTVTKITPEGVSSTFATNSGTVPNGMIKSKLNNNLYIANSGSGTVAVVNSCGEASAYTTLQYAPFDIAMDSSGIIYTTNGVSKTITKINP